MRAALVQHGHMDAGKPMCNMAIWMQECQCTTWPYGCRNVDFRLILLLEANFYIRGNINVNNYANPFQMEK